MTTQISDHTGYTTLLAEIETYLHKVTQHGSFNSLSPVEADKLHRLSLLAEAYEKSVPLMPIRVPKTLLGMIHVKMA